MSDTSPETQIEIEALARVLRDLAIDATASYTELSAAVGYSVQRDRLALLKARELVEQQTGFRFSTVWNVGVKKLPAAAVAGIGVQARRRISRRAKHAADRLTGLRYNEIDRASQARIDAERSLLGMISFAAKADTKPLEQETAETTGPIVALKVLDHLKAQASS